MPIVTNNVWKPMAEHTSLSEFEDPNPLPWKKDLEKP